MKEVETLIKEEKYGDLFIKLSVVETTTSFFGTFDTSYTYDTTYCYKIVMRYDKDKKCYCEISKKLSDALIAFDKLNELLRSNK